METPELIEERKKNIVFCIFPLSPDRLNCGLDRLRTNIDFNLVCLRTRYGKHECSSITKIALERDRPCTLRQLVVKCVQFEIDVAELPLDVRDIFGELDVHVSRAGQRDRTNSVVRSGAGMNRLVLGNSV